MIKSLTALALLSTGCALAQSPTVGGILEGQLKSAESEIVSLVKAMPESKMNFAPSNGEFKRVRTFAQQANHISTVLYMVSAAAKSEKPPVDLGAGENGPDSIKSKDQIVKFMQDAFAYARATASGATAESFTRMVKAPWGNSEMPVGALLTLGASHSFDHYGQMVVYARMNGVIPPASMPQK